MTKFARFANTLQSLLPTHNYQASSKFALQQFGMILRVLIYGLVFLIASSTRVVAQSKPACNDPSRGKKSCDSHSYVIQPTSSLPIVSTNAQHIIIRYVNPLRYRYSLTSTSQAIAAPTPPSVIAPSPAAAAVLPPSSHVTSTADLKIVQTARLMSVGPVEKDTDKKAQAAAEAAKAAVGDVDKAFRALWANAVPLGLSLNTAIQNLNATIVALSQEQQCYADRLLYFVPSILKDEEKTNLSQFVTRNEQVRVVGEQTPQSCRLRTTYDWPNDILSSIDTDLHKFQAEQGALVILPGYADWIAVPANKAENDQLTSFFTTNIALVESKQAPSTQFSTFAASLAYVMFWRTKISDIYRELKAYPDPDKTGSPFYFSSSVDCAKTWYGRGNTVTVTLVVTDLSVSPATQATSQILTNTCYPSGTISTGIGISFVHDRVFAFLPGIDPANSANTVSTVQTTTDAAVTPLYAIQYNIAIFEGNGTVGLHGTIGGGIGSTAGTTNLELLVGPAMSLRRRAFFITPAFQLARRDQLLPGFKIGSVQGNGLASLPIRTNWQSGFALTFTFGIGP